MYSFYGGKQGRTYHIVKTYASIADMVAAFAGGGQYTDVMYHEYVLIDTSNTNLNDPENGCLYRRGFDYNIESVYTKPDLSDESNYSGTNLTVDAQTALDNYIHDPGHGAIYVGCIRGSDGPGMALNDPISKQHLATSVSNTNQITVKKEIDRQVGEHSTYSLTFDFPIPTFATPTVNTIVQKPDGEKYNASVTIKPQDDAPFYLNSSFDILQGLKGDSITSVNYGGDAGNRRINFYATTQSRDEEGKITEAQGLLGTVSYYGLEKLGVNSSNMHLMATYTQPSMNTSNPSSTVEDLGELKYGIVSQNTVYRMDTNGDIYPSKLPEFHQGDKPIVLQTLNTSADSTNSADVTGTFLLGYDTNTTHTSQFDKDHTLSESKWYKMQEISGVTADPGKIITAGVMSSSTKYGNETVEYSNNIKPNIDLLAPGGFILNAYDTEIHEFGTNRDTHPTVEEFQEATAGARQGQWTNGSPSISEYYKERRRYVYYV